MPAKPPGVAVALLPIAGTVMRNHVESYSPPAETPLRERKAELRSFLFLTIVMMPVLAVVVVGGYGFIVWIYQIFAGPPTG